MKRLISFAAIVGVVSILLTGIAIAQSVDAQKECSNCAWEFSPGHDEDRRGGESARDFAPGQEVGIGNPNDFAPGQEKRQAPPDPE